MNGSPKFSLPEFPLYASYLKVQVLISDIVPRGHEWHIAICKKKAGLQVNDDKIIDVDL